MVGWGYAGTVGGMDLDSNKFRYSNLPNLDDFQEAFDHYDTPVGQRRHRLHVVVCTKCGRKSCVAHAFVGLAVLEKCYGLSEPNGFQRPLEHSRLLLPLARAMVVEFRTPQLSPSRSPKGGEEMPAPCLLYPTPGLLTILR